MKLSRVLIAGLLVAVAGIAQAGTYRFDDARDVSLSAADFSTTSTGYRVELEEVRLSREVSVDDAGLSSRFRKVQPVQLALADIPRVEIYMTAWCDYCKRLEKYLKEKGVPFVTYDVEKNDDAMRTYRKLGGRGVPLTRVGKDVIYGYNPEMVMSSFKGK